MPNYRLTYFYAFLVCVFLMLAALYFQYVDGFEPCLLCMLQRFVVVILGVFFFFASLHQHNRLTRRLYNAVLMIFSILGLLVSGRQVYLQHLPPNTQDFCVPGYSVLVKSATWSTLLKYALTGTPDCGVVDWRFWGLSMAGWSFVFFAIFFLIILWQFWRKHNS